jgi:hypothetical protein
MFIYSFKKTSPLFQRLLGRQRQLQTYTHMTTTLFVVYLTTLFQYLRLYSVDFYSVLIRLPSSSEAGETRVRKWPLNFADEYLSCL